MVLLLKFPEALGRCDIFEMVDEADEIVEGDEAVFGAVDNVDDEGLLRSESLDLETRRY